ncbi:MAG: hypothetical protein WCI03_04720 [bacterium]
MAGSRWGMPGARIRHGMSIHRWLGGYGWLIFTRCEGQGRLLLRGHWAIVLRRGQVLWRPINHHVRIRGPSMLGPSTTTAMSAASPATIRSSWIWST